MNQATQCHHEQERKKDERDEPLADLIDVLSVDMRTRCFHLGDRKNLNDEEIERIEFLKARAGDLKGDIQSGLSGIVRVIICACDSDGWDMKIEEISGLFEMMQTLTDALPDLDCLEYRCELALNQRKGPMEIHAEREARKGGRQ